MSKLWNTKFAAWAGAILLALAFGAISVPADADDAPTIYRDNSVKVAPPPRPSVETEVVPGEHQERERNHTSHSHNEKRLQMNLDEQRAERESNRGEHRGDDKSE